jgi:hypothetical protein
MTKNFTIGALLLIAIMLALRPDPEGMCTDDPNTVVIEYECSSLDEYDDVPLEVTTECRKRAIESTIHSKTKI